MKLNTLTKKQRLQLQCGCDSVGPDYYFLEGGDFSKIKDPGFQLRLSEWRQARSEFLRYAGMEVD